MLVMAGLDELRGGVHMNFKGRPGERRDPYGEDFRFSVVAEAFSNLRG
jgi:hypothetical protein